MKYLVFDTETSGLPPYEYRKEIFNLLKNEKSAWDKLLNKWPYLMQLTYVIYDTETNELNKIYNKYIETPESIITNLENTISELKNKNDEKALKGAGVLQGNLNRWNSSIKVNVCNLMKEFLIDINSVDGVVAHNINFDLLMMIATGKRVGDDCDIKLLELLNYENFGDKKICTMKEGTQICKLPFMEADGITPKPLKTYTDKKTGEVVTNYKSPTLSKLYEHEFGQFPNEELLHDSLFDVILTLRVFIKMKFGKDICVDRPENPNELTKELYEKLSEVSPEGDACKGSPLKAGKKRTRKIKGKKMKKSKKVKRRKRGGMDEPVPEPLTLSMLDTSNDSNDSIPNRTDLEESSINQSFDDLDLSMINVDEEDGPNQLDISFGNMEPLTLSMLDTSQNDSVLDKTDEEDESFGGKSKKVKKKSKKAKKKSKKKSKKVKRKSKKSKN
tara:strand:- start:14888 stop:16222 length:1335 start_codon:yes stop_codon:yes gene_type:complete